MGRRYDTNSVGFRSRELSPNGRPRIVVTGDSVTVGCGVDAEEAYPQLSETLLRGRGVDVDVVNAGAAGINAQVAVDRLGVAERYAPQVLVYGITLNDVESPAYTPMSAAAHLAHSATFHRFDDSPFMMLRLAWPALMGFLDARAPEESYERELLDNWRGNATAWDAFTAALDDLKKRARGRCTIILMHPYFAHLHPWHPFLPVYARIEAAAKERGFVFVNPLDRFIWHRGSSYWIAPTDPHPNAEGHRVLAEALTAAITALPSRCWSYQVPVSGRLVPSINKVVRPWLFPNPSGS